MSHTTSILISASLYSRVFIYRKVGFFFYTGQNEVIYFSLITCCEFQSISYHVQGNFYIYMDFSLNKNISKSKQFKRNIEHNPLLNWYYHLLSLFIEPSLLSIFLSKLKLIKSIKWWKIINNLNNKYFNKELLETYLFKFSTDSVKENYFYNWKALKQRSKLKQKLMNETQFN